MATAHNRKQGPLGGLSWGRNTGSGAEHRAALSVAVKNKTGQKDLMRTISPKKKEKKKGPKKQTKPNSLKAGGWLSSRDPVFPLPTQCRLNNTSFSEGGSWGGGGRGGGILPSGPSVEPLPQILGSRWASSPRHPRYYYSPSPARGTSNSGERKGRGLGH